MHDSQHLESMCAEIRDAVAHGRLDDALEVIPRALQLAQAGGDTTTVDRILLSRGAILVARGEGEQVVSEMRRILMRSADRGNRFNAAYAISQHHRMVGDLEKGRFYANTALSYAQAWNDASAIAKAYNDIANIELLSSYFEDAAASYDKALGHLADVESADKAVMLSNLGYCHTVLGRFDRGFSILYSSLRLLRRLGADHLKHLPMLGLAYAYVEIGRYDRAERHARRALELADAAGYQDNQVKNALFLLGEATKLANRDVEAYEHFTHLQRRFYPDQPMIVDVLLATDIRKLINLMA
ncbi:MAG: tetratricopeptide repeat protein [Acidobacteriota bacterium]